MNIFVHIPEEIARRLEKYISSNNSKDQSKNTFIVKAIEQRLYELNIETNWSKKILDC